MDICLQVYSVLHITVIVCNHIFLINFTFMCSEIQQVDEKLTHYLFFLFMVSAMVKIVAPYLNQSVQ